MATVNLTADKLTAEDSIKLKTREVTDIAISISSPGSDSNLMTEKAFITFISDYLGKVGISASDTTLSYLYNKITTGSGLSKVITSGGGNETLTITNTIRSIIALEDVGLTAEPTSDKILYWNNTTGEWTSLAVGTNLSITGGVLNAAATPDTTIEYRADKVTTVANTPQSVTFSSTLGTVDADVVVMVNAVDTSGNVVIPTVTSITISGFTLETATASTAYYQAFIKK